MATDQQAIANKANAGATMVLIWRILPLLLLANTGFAKIDYDVFAFSFCPDDGISFEIGRIKGEKFQVSFFHGLYIDNVDKGPKDSWRSGAGVLGFGMRKLLDSDGKRELGFLIWPVYTQEFHRRKQKKTLGFSEKHTQRHTGRLQIFLHNSTIV